MWGDKRPDAPTRSPLPQQPSTVSSAPSFSGEAKKMAPIDSTYPTTTANDRSTARLGGSCSGKGKKTGKKDLHIGGSDGGWVQWEDRKLTVGASARVTADII